MPSQIEATVDPTLAEETAPAKPRWPGFGAIWPELRRRSPALAWTGLAHWVLLGVALLLMMADERTLLGINVWVKPAKFMASLAVYLWTVGWLMGEVRAGKWVKRVLGVGISFAMIVETVILFTQSFRGTTSHFNISTALDGSLFGMMGTMIAVDTVLMAVLLLLFLRRHPDLNPAYLWGIRVGIAVFLIGGWVGGQMIVNGAHTVGAPDGGAGLPFLNWSTTHGDLRIAHALGLHGLQIFPVVGFLSGYLQGSSRKGVALVTVLALAYAALVIGAFAQARSGVPLFPLG